MGIYLSLYGINLNEINQIINSKDNVIYDKIINSIKTAYNFTEPFETGETIEKVIKDIVFGNCTQTKQNIAYNYGAVVICEIFKKKLPNTVVIKYSFETNLINEYLKNDFNISDLDINTLIAANPGILKMPDIFSNFNEDLYECPALGILTTQNLIWIKNKLKKGNHR